MTDRMESVDHSHPTQRAVAGAYRRGRDADGLRTDGAGEDAGTESRERMRDVSHTPADGDGTNEVWARGDGDTEQGEGPDDDE
jgi:hypothetical protein